MSVITEFQSDDITSNIKLFYINKLDKTIDNTFTDSKNKLRDFDGVGLKLKLNPNIYVFGDAAYNDDSFSWHIYLPGTKNTFLVNNHDIVGNISTRTTETLVSQPLLSTNIIAYGFNDHTYTQTLFTSEKYYTPYVLASYLTCCMPLNKFVYAKDLIKTGTWTAPNMASTEFLDTQYGNCLQTSQNTATLEYNFVNIRYCCVAFVEPNNTSSASWTFKINDVISYSHVHSTPSATNVSSQNITSVFILDCGSVGDYNIKVSSTNTNVKYCFWFCGFNSDDAKNLGRPTLVCSIPRVDPVLAVSGTYQRLIQVEDYMKNVIKQCQLMGLPITFYNWSTPDGLFNDIYYKPSNTKYKKLGTDILKYAFL